MPTSNFFSFFLAPKRMKKTTDARVSACLCTVLWFTLPLCLIFEYKRRKKKKKKRATFPQLRPFLLLFQQNSTQSTIGFVNNKKSCNYFSFPFFIRFRLWEEEAEKRKHFANAFPIFWTKRRDDDHFQIDHSFLSWTAGGCYSIERVAEKDVTAFYCTMQRQQHLRLHPPHHSLTHVLRNRMESWYISTFAS